MPGQSCAEIWHGARFNVGAQGCAGEWGNFNIMNTMLKNNAGFDLKQLFIGSEGTLGGITGAVLRLHEAPMYKNSARCALPDHPSVLRTLRLMRQTLGADLSAFDIMGPEFYASASQVRQIKPLPVKDNFYLLVEQECTNENPHLFEPALGQWSCGWAFNRGSQRAFQAEQSEFLAIAGHLWRFAASFLTQLQFGCVDTDSRDRQFCLQTAFSFATALARGENDRVWAYCRR